jgi:hypothetical protein
MADSPNPWQPELSQQAQNAVPTVSAPPVEVSIRTMASDLASLGETGGGPPRAMNVAVPSLSRFETPVSQPKPGENQAAAVAVGEEVPVAHASRSSRLLIWAFASLFGVIVLFLGGYYFIPLLSSPKTVQQPPPTVHATSSIPSNTPPPAPPKVAFEHHSVFTQPVDGIFILNLASSSDGMKVYIPQAGALLGGTSASSSLFEAELRDADGNPPSAEAFLTSSGANVFDQNFLGANFNSDFTLFFYKDKNGAWPGYIFSLMQNGSPILLQQDLRKIENASNIANLFLNDPGTPETSFKDVLVSGQPVRVLGFSDKKSVLAYGWLLNKYLIVSTSLEGIKQALARF